MKSIINRFLPEKVFSVNLRTAHLKFTALMLSATLASTIAMPGIKAIDPEQSPPQEKFGVSEKLSETDGTIAKILKNYKKSVVSATFMAVVLIGWALLKNTHTPELEAKKGGEEGKPIVEMPIPEKEEETFGDVLYSLDDLISSFDSMEKSAPSLEVAKKPSLPLSAEGLSELAQIINASR